MMLSGTYSDIGTQDYACILSIDWGEGRFNVAVSGGMFSFTHQYLDYEPNQHIQRYLYDYDSR
ncbi:MAG: hypothetical protein U0905_22370 [Pirellulales bacterium]